MKMNLLPHCELAQPATPMDTSVKLPAPQYSTGPPLGTKGSLLPPGWYTPQFM